MSNLNKMSNKDFREILEELVGDMSTDEILSYGDVYSTLAEALNNEVLERWQERHPSPPELPDFSEYDIVANAERDPDENEWNLVLTLKVGVAPNHVEFLYLANEFYCWTGEEGIDFVAWQTKSWIRDEAENSDIPVEVANKFLTMMETAAELGWEYVKFTDPAVLEYLEA